VSACRRELLFQTCQGDAHAIKQRVVYEGFFPVFFSVATPRRKLEEAESLPFFSMRSGAARGVGEDRGAA
jgi:hypothetical protein